MKSAKIPNVHRFSLLTRGLGIVHMALKAKHAKALLTFRDLKFDDKEQLMVLRFRVDPLPETPNESV